METITASILFAGDAFKYGSQKCYYCGANCSIHYSTKEYVKSTFTNRDIIKYPDSKYVCIGCVQSLGQGGDKMLMIDNSIKIRENSRGMQPRNYSWILTKHQKWAATKAHIKEIREIIFNPPEPPFSIILADSGKKQLIFRAPISLSKNNYPILLEENIIEVDIERLKEYIKLSTKISAAIGKPVLLTDISYNHFFRYEQYFGDISDLESWIKIKNEPLASLAVWLTVGKKEAQNEYIKC